MCHTTVAEEDNFEFWIFGVGGLRILEWNLVVKNVEGLGIQGE